MKWPALLLIFMGGVAAYKNRPVTAYNCEEGGPPQNFGISVSRGCSDKLINGVTGTPADLTVYRVSREKEQEAEFCSVSRQTFDYWCTWDRDATSALTAEQNQMPTAITTSGSVCKTWVESNTASGEFNSVGLTPGEEKTVHVSAHIGDDMFCTVRSQWIIVTRYVITRRTHKIIHLYDAEGKSVGVQTDEGETVLVTRSGEGTTISGTGVTWDPKHEPDCPLSKVYSGNGTKIFQSGKPIGYTASVRKAGFRTTGTAHVCGHQLTQTTDPYMYVSEHADIGTEDFISYDASPLVGLIRGGVEYLDMTAALGDTTLAKKALLNLCKMEQSVQIGAMYASKDNPEELGLQLMNKPGYKATVAGAAVRIRQCTMVSAQMWPDEVCYDKFPVKVAYTDKRMFMDPLTKTLSQVANVIDCNDESLPLIQVEGSWIKLEPELEIVHVASDLTSESIYSYERAAGGEGLIYANSVVEKIAESLSWSELQKHINVATKNAFKGSVHSAATVKGCTELTETTSALVAGVVSHSVLIGLLIMGCIMAGGCVYAWSRNGTPGSTVNTTVKFSPGQDTEKELDLTRIEELRGMLDP